MRYTLALVCAIIATPAAAEQLLLEVYHGNNWYDHGFGRIPSANVIQTLIWTGRETDALAYAEWVFYAEPSHVGQTFAAPDWYIYNLNAAIPKGNAFIRSFIGWDGPYTDFSQTVMIGEPSPAEGFRFKTFFQPLGPGLIGYRVTRAEMRIDAVEMYYPHGPDWFLFRNAAGTFRVYGQPIPEPAALLFAVCAFLPHLLSRRRRTHEI